jgi:diguanylate cyclase (GGDEF)-like protein/PAS domain S-box-containing protein
MSLNNLIESSPILKRILASIPVSIVITAQDGSIEYVNPFFEDMTGYTAREAIGCSPRILKSGFTPEETYTELWQTILAGETWRGRFVNKTRDGRVYVEEARIAPVYGASGRIEHFVAIKEDVTAFVEAQRVADAQRRELDAILDTIPAWVFYKDTENRFIRVNRAFAEAAVMSRNDFEGVSCFDLYPREQAEAFWKDDKEVIASGHPKPAIIEQVTLHDGNHWLQTEKMPFRDVNGEIVGVVGFAIDITHLKSLEQKVQELSVTDELTGLNNRRGFFARAADTLHLAKRLGIRCTLLFADMDGLKTINDTLGHAAGDNALRELSAILRDSARNTDIIARLGGDEFVIMTLNSRAEDCFGLTNRIVAAVSARNAESNRDYLLSISIGTSEFDPNCETTLDDLLKQADEAMYRVKSAKRSKAHGSPGS